MQLIKKILKGLRAILITTPIYFLSKFFIRNKNIWVIGYKKGFLDNSKHFYIQYCEILKKEYNIELIWIAKEASSYISASQLSLGKVYKAYSFKGIISLARAKAYISSNSAGDDLPFFLSAGALNIYLWHGIGIKKMKYMDSRKSIQKLLNSKLLKVLYPSIFIKPDLMLSTSEHMSKHFASCFNIDINKCFIAAYPRCKPLTSSHNELVNSLCRYENDEVKKLIDSLCNFNKVFLYMPTWRDNDPNFLNRTEFNWPQLNELLRMNNSILLLKSHPYSILPNLKSSENIFVFQNHIDLYPILPFTDVLITDYSSIYFDYLLCKNKSIILFPFDQNDYYTSCRELAYDYNKHMPGVRISNLIEILSSDIIDKNIRLKAKQNEIKKLYWDEKAIRKNDLIKKIISLTNRKD